MKIALILLLAFVGACIAASPTNPVWPKSFSAGIVVTSKRNPFFTRLFSDSKLQATRNDGTLETNTPGQLVFTQRFVNYTTKQEYHVYYQGDTAACFTRPTRGVYPAPDFSNYNYLGPVLIGYTTVYRWGLRNNTNDVFTEIFVDGNGDPYRFLVVDNEGNQEVWTFFEFDSGSQDPDLFVIPAPILSICTPEPTPPPRTTTTGGNFLFN